MRPNPDGTARTDSDGVEVRASRHLRSQLLSRRINDEIAKRRYSSAFGEYSCECGMKTCAAPISLTPDEFAEIRAQPGRFVVQRGHVVATFEEVVEETERFQVVESRDVSAQHYLRPSLIAEGSAELL